MSDIDLTKAVDAGARAWFACEQARRTDDGRHRPDGQPWTWDDQHAGDQFMMREIVLPIVAAAAGVDALISRDLISSEHYDILTRPVRLVLGPIHPDDEDVTP
jgi:hypothetical protein